ncbi:LOW QUALITY PROTEIN: dipeptidyl peptidase 1-like [Uloborus diversus]|uniref:LOW QUALITY PROTEIN: dipeptidyl peptidase 1-like n=1 Tax=Uloborus diversus TaxID=327109 RepID=UPI002409665E|nr:LOW QUALITY PROTEIN: dipeptidyl peptidase 1-like [Uloborus diversus]
MRRLCFLVALLVCSGYVDADTPANCTYEDIRGEWIFVEGRREFDSGVNCTGFDGPATHTVRLRLQFPNVVVDAAGNKGYWTIVYNQGFEVVINYRKYFAFSLYEQDPDGKASARCDRTLPGWSHDVLGKNWACYIGRKVRGKTLPKVYERNELYDYSTLRSTFYHSNAYVDFINRVQKSWRAKVYPELDNMSPTDLLRRAGGVRSRIDSLQPSRHPRPPLILTKMSKVSPTLPAEFDWRNVSGINYVSPVRNQGSCGSCYAFSSLAMLESRLRIMTNNSLKVTFSPQDIVSCSDYSQGCEGGFPYAIAGKYAQDFGVVPEDCFPYEGHDGDCNAKKCKRYYVARYKYVGGYFGGCNEELMKLDLLQNGPLTVAFEVYPDFMNYAGGIYHHTGVGARFNPFYLVNHGVLITGYGISNESGEKFWIVKNSWGTGWGENGYFRIRRGTNECNIESMAVSAIPIP